MGITNTGFAALAGLAGNIGSVDPFIYLANGSVITAFEVLQTALLGENSGSGSDRAVVTPTRVQTTVANDTLQLQNTWSITGAITVNEVAVLNAASGGIMGARSVTAATRTLTSGDSYQATYKIQFA